MGLGEWFARQRELTIQDDARTRVARSQHQRRARIQREEYVPGTDQPMLWFDITVPSLGGYADVPIQWQADDREHARESFLEWLNAQEWHTVDFMNNGKEVRLTFRTAWVPGFTIGQGRTRRG